MRTKFLAAVAILLVMTVCNVNANLIVNGDFEDGVTGYTTDYTYFDGGTYPGLYCISTNPYNWSNGYESIYDHTSGSGNMMLIDAAGGAGGHTGQTCWSETVAVTQNTDYTFSAWIAQIYFDGTVYSNLQFKINGTVIGSYDVPSNTSEWREFTEVWNSGSAVTATIIIRETTGDNAGGNDFALDDIYFAVPEPTTICLLTLGALSLIRRKK